MNVFISIIEEAYVSIKMKSQNHWIYSYLKLDEKYVEINNKENGNGKTEDKNSLSPLKKGKEETKFSKMNSMSLSPGRSLANNTIDQLYDKNFERMVSKVNSKNMLREILLNNENEGNKFKGNDKREKTKEELEKILENYFKNVKKIYYFNFIEFRLIFV